MGGSDAPGHAVHSFSKTPLDGKVYYCDITDTDLNVTLDAYGGKMEIYAQWIKIKRADIKKLTCKKGKINVKYSKVKNIDSYIIQISSKKNFKSGKTKEYNVNKSKKNKK